MRVRRPIVVGLWVISGILHVLKTGCRWRDVPAEYGPATTAYNRYHRWARRGIWQRIFESSAATGPVPAELSIDSSHVEAHRSAQSSKGRRGRKRVAPHVVDERAKSMLWPMIRADQWPSHRRRATLPTSAWQSLCLKELRLRSGSLPTTPMLPTGSATG
ncbi:hypothetical protein CH339_16365 [Rhodobium orientis]|uniref:Insertion element IS402-like domain-containing protein n=1 Tax=Rhodobium orientis TaxID=34017 RepID=A0A327JHZ7_9HYPH|nr:hypothetical protein CH339_16365 [Rhodobium orientis]